jgi:type III secretion protein C
MNNRMLRFKFCIITFLFHINSFVLATNVPWPENSFTYIADSQPLNRVLSSFCRTFGLELQASSAVLSRNEIVNGKISTNTPTEFLDQIAATYGLQWFYSNGVLFVSRSSETVTKSFIVNGTSLTNFRKALLQIGVLNEKFGWGELADRGVVIVSGPPAYVDQLGWAVATMPLPQIDQQIKVFRLKYAQVNDRVITYRDQRITTPGVATLLRSLIAGDRSQLSGATTAPGMSQLETVANPLQPLGAQGEKNNEKPELGKSSNSSSSNSDNSGGSGSGERKNTTTIQADSRLNAIIVKDTPQRMAIYEELIQSLDVPTKLVEIEAVIVDVNSSRVSDLGIDWGGRAGNVAGGFGVPGATPDVMTGTVAFGKGVSPNTVIADAGNFLMARVRILEGSGDARIVSRPSILTQDNLGALIDLSETFYVQSVGERVANVVPVSAGTTLKVTPHIIESANGSSVQLTVDIEDGALTKVKVQTLPTVTRSIIGTQAVMREKESLLIGGFNSESEDKSEDRVPGLGSIPLFGIFFKRKTTNFAKRERLFLITPKIVSDSSISIKAVN